MNKIQCEYCQSLNEGNALECCKCGAPLPLVPPGIPMNTRIVESGGSGNGYVAAATDDNYVATKSIYTNLISWRL